MGAGAPAMEARGWLVVFRLYMLGAAHKRNAASHRDNRCSTSP